jgi:hypothetical protein
MKPSPAENGELPRAWVEAWRSDEVEPVRSHLAYQRFLAGRRGGPLPTLQIVRWVLVGVVIGMGSVYAATGPLRWLEPAPVASASQSPAKVRAHARSSTSVVQPVAATSARSEEASLPARSEPVPFSAAPSASVREQWQRAARGLRDKDFVTADAALEELARHGSVGERESARLAQAQLLIAQGRGEDAKVVLRELRASAQSLGVREKASELLAGAPAIHPSRRSFEPAPGANEP